MGCQNGPRFSHTTVVLDVKTFRQKTRSLAPMNGWACAVKICHDGMLEDTNSLDGAQMSMPRKEEKMFSYNGTIAGSDSSLTIGRPWSTRKTRSSQPLLYGDCRQ